MKNLESLIDSWIDKQISFYRTQYLENKNNTGILDMIDDKIDALQDLKSRKQELVEGIESMLAMLSVYKITLIRYEDEWKSWRLGLDWNSEDDYEYIVEQPTIMECLQKAIEYHLNESKKPIQ